MVQNTPPAASADPDGGVRALAIRGFEPRIFRRPKGLYLLGLAATRAAARFIPFRGAGRGPGTGQRFQGRVSQKVKLSLEPYIQVSESLTFWDTLPSKRCPV